MLVRVGLLVMSSSTICCRPMQCPQYHGIPSSYAIPSVDYCVEPAFEENKPIIQVKLHVQTVSSRNLAMRNVAYENELAKREKYELYNKLDYF